MRRISACVLLVGGMAGCGGGGDGPDPDAGRDAGAVLDAGPGPAEDAGPGDPLDALCADVEARQLATGAPGWGIAIIEDGEVVVLKAGGIRDVGEPDAMVTEETPFRTLGLSELFTAIAALEADADPSVTALDLDAPVVSVLPSLAIEPAAWAATITIRDLMHQTGGLPSRIRRGVPEFGESIASCATPEDTTIAGWVTELNDHRMGAPPGRFQIRDIVSAAVLAQVLVATDPMKRTFAEIVRDRVFVPAGMSGAHVGWDADPDVPHARGHDATSVVITPLSPSGLCEAHQPINLAFVGIADLARFAQILARGGLNPDGTRVFSAETVDAVLGGLDAPSWVSGEMRAGCGLHPWPTGAGTISTLLHVGFGYGIGFAIARERRFAAVVVRNESTSPFREGIQPILDARLDAGVNRQYSPEPTWSVDAATLAPIAGTYRNVAGDVVEIAVAGEGLQAMVTLGTETIGPALLEPRLPDRFNFGIPGSPAVRLYRDAAGAPIALWAQYVDHPFWRDPPGIPSEVD
jgi:CubicO group peptidase (beta-lactamase class C family)